MPDYRFSGTLDQGRKKTSFKRVVEGKSPEHAESNLYAELGSEHSVKRGRINIESQEEV